MEVKLARTVSRELNLKIICAYTGLALWLGVGVANLLI